MDAYLPNEGIGVLGSFELVRKLGQGTLDGVVVGEVLLVAHQDLVGVLDLAPDNQLLLFFDEARPLEILGSGKHITLLHAAEDFDKFVEAQTTVEHLVHHVLGEVAVDLLEQAILAFNLPVVALGFFEDGGEVRRVVELLGPDEVDAAVDGGAEGRVHFFVEAHQLSSGFVEGELAVSVRHLLHDVR